MPLASLACLQWYGPATAALRASGTGGVGLLEQSSAIMTKRTGASIGGVGVATTLRPYRGRAFNLVNGGIGAMQSQARKRNRFGLEVSIGGQLTQDDVTGAVFEAPVEGDISLKQAIRILLAHAAGNATGLEGTSPVFKSAVDSAKTRIAGSYASGNRTVTTLDGS
jgi:hypothetical protein